MKTTLLLSLTASLLFTGCGAFNKSVTWEKVIDVHRDHPRSPNAPDAYATDLHRALKKGEVAHKIVKYQYRYTTRMREEAVGTGTAVVYRDNSNPDNPWWLIDEHRAKPVWLPGNDLNQQVAFFLRRDAQIIEERDFTGRGAPASHAAVASTRINTGRAITRIAREKRPSEKAVPSTASVSQPEDWGQIFRNTHGTSYDPMSALDRRKMDGIKQAQLQHEDTTRRF